MRLEIQVTGFAFLIGGGKKAQTRGHIQGDKPVSSAYPEIGRGIRPVSQNAPRFRHQQTGVFPVDIGPDSKHLRIGLIIRRIKWGSLFDLKIIGIERGNDFGGIFPGLRLAGKGQKV